VTPATQTRITDAEDRAGGGGAREAPAAAWHSAEMEVRETAVDAQPVRYRACGAGAPLVLVHGLAGSWRWWAPAAGVLAERRAVYLVDLPRPRRAHAFEGLSAWLGRWLDAVGLERVDLAGHSLGGLFAAELAARRPERVRRLVLVAPAGISCERALPRRAVALLDSLYHIRAWASTVVADALSVGALRLLAGIAFEAGCDVRPELAGVRAPTLLAWGARDRLVPIRLAEDWQRLLPAARVERLSCRHVPMLEAPGELAAAMLGFLDGELGDDVRDEAGPGVVDGVRLSPDRHEPASR
jgi:pimeloyl-ACP methyl ester carboxylesterase